MELLPYITAFKGCIGCIQMAQLLELQYKLKILMQDPTSEKLVSMTQKRRQIFLIAGCASLLSLIVIYVPNYYLSTAYD